jgi:LPPG:FO 2-phospho-L-lactate transferase
MMILSGGTGTPKLIMGLKELMKPEELSVVVNTAEDIWISGNYISPDVDSVLYTLADMIDEKRMWGIKGDRTVTYDYLIALGIKETLQVGDRDRAVHIFRSDLMREGASLSQATGELAKALGIMQHVVPMTDNEVSTMLYTPEGLMHFQEFWAERRGKPEIISILFGGLKEAKPSPGFLDLLEKEDTVLIGPSNPVTSIGPILKLPGVREKLAEKKVIAVSPLVGDKPVSGPIAKLMTALEYPVSDEGVREMLGKVDLFIVDKKSSYGGDCLRMSTRMKTKAASLKVAKELLGLINVNS